MSRAWWVGTQWQISPLAQQWSPRQEAAIYHAFHQILAFEDVSLAVWIVSIANVTGDVVMHVFTLGDTLLYLQTAPYSEHMCTYASPKFLLFPFGVYPLHLPPLWVLQGLFRSPWQPNQVGGSIHNGWCSQILVPPPFTRTCTQQRPLHQFHPPPSAPSPTHSSSSSPRSLFATAAASWPCPEPSGGFPAPSPFPCSQEGKAGKGGKYNFRHTTQGHLGNLVRKAWGDSCNLHRQKKKKKEQTSFPYLPASRRWNWIN